MDADNDGSIPGAPEWQILEVCYNPERNDADMAVMCNGRRVVIRTQADFLSSSPSLEERFLFLLKVADQYELDGYTREDLGDWLAEPLLPTFHQLATLEPPPNTLEAFLFPDIYFFKLEADGDSLVPVPEKPKYESDSKIFGIAVPEELCSTWPRLSPAEIRVSKHVDKGLIPSVFPTRVRLEDGSLAYLKLARRGDDGWLIPEIRAYQKIHKANLDKDLRIPRIHGLVRDDTGMVYGMLLTFIDCRRTTLFCAAKATPDKAIRRKWFDQIEHTVAQLHREGLAWGDAKPDNVLIDRDQNAWVIDFGDAYTEGWVPKELAGSLEGDLVALGKIKEFLVLK